MAVNVPTEGSGDGITMEDDDKCLVHETFKEVDEMKHLIQSLETIWQDTVAMEMAEERFRSTVVTVFLSLCLL